ncbi:hypothetical protein D3C80_1984920 [compost metagenome]
MGLDGGLDAQAGQLAVVILALLIMEFGSRLGLAQPGYLVIDTPMQEHIIGPVQVGELFATQQRFVLIDDLEFFYAVGHQPYLLLLACP